MKVDDLIIKYIPLQQGLRLSEFQTRFHIINTIIKYIPLQQGLRRKYYLRTISPLIIIKYIPLQQGLRRKYYLRTLSPLIIIKYIPLQQGLRLCDRKSILTAQELLSTFHYNKD